MTLHTRALRNVFIVSSLFTLGACEIGTEKREIAPDDSSVISYFFSDQFATDDARLRNFFSVLYGAIVAAGPEAKLELWENPEPGCYVTAGYLNAANRDAAIRRRLDAGALQIRLADDALVDLTKNPSLTYVHPDALAPGDYALVGPGLRNGALKFEASFQVPEKGGNIRVETVLDAEAGPILVEQTLASPALPTAQHPAYRVVFNRMTDSWVRFDAPAGTDYVRVNLNDLSENPYGNITCFGEPGQAIKIPQGALYGFRTGLQGYMEVDFVKVSKTTDIPRVKTLSIVSSMKHFQGTFEWTDSNGVKRTESAGLIEFR